MIIREYELFDGFDNQAIEEVMGATATENYEAGHVLFRQGDPADGFYVLEKGSIQLSVSGVEGAVYIASKIGETIGWSSVAGRDTYSAEAVCQETTRVVRFDKAGLEEVLRSNPAVGLRFYRGLAMSVGGRLVECHNKLIGMQEGMRGAA
jgi:CRP-like cAMP-binding protein